ncbi:MAG: DNRLRE domain-containing protein, partial [Oscillospiraceae bacterium]|nr:DNRLRE domain-containing protein [Oscillospiraceae bacterium]
MKKFTILTLVAVILLGMTSCNALSGKPATEKWIAPNNTVSAWFRADWTGDTAPGMLDIYDTTSLHIGKTADGADIFALLRVPLSGTWLAGEIKGARLFLKIREGAVPSELRVGFASEPWSFADTTLAQAERFCDPSGLESVSVRSEADGWISLEVTKFVKAWLNCDMPNYGFSLFSDKPGEELVIEAADWEEENPRFPYLEVSG